jgi:rhodanese-related sulfurtransferase
MPGFSMAQSLLNLKIIVSELKQMEPNPAKIYKYILPIFCVLILLFLTAISGCQRYSARFIGIQSMGASDLHKTIKSHAKPLIIDIREARVYRKGHIPGAIRIDMDSIEGYLENIQIPLQRIIVTVCVNGWQSQVTAASIMARGYRNVYNLVGGTTAWMELGYPLKPATGLDPAATILKPPITEISLLSQLAMTLAAFVVKPAYIVMTFLIIVMLWRKKSRDLVLIRYAMVLFFIGENACSLNYLVASNSSGWLEIVHGLGMVGMFFLLSWGLVVYFDERVIHYLNPERSCVFQRHCQRCWKKENVSCGLHRLAIFLLPALAFTAFIPVTMPLRPFRIIMPVFLTDVLWLKDFWNLFLEFRLYPILGALCFIISYFWTRKGQHALQKAQLPFFLALGFTFYSYFRFGLLLTFSENQAWADWWEESTEFIMVALIMIWLVVFKNQLELKRPWNLKHHSLPPSNNEFQHQKRRDRNGQKHNHIPKIRREGFFPTFPDRKRKVDVGMFGGNQPAEQSKQNQPCGCRGPGESGHF